MLENDESRLAVAMAKMVADHMHCLEEAVWQLVPRMEAEVTTCLSGTQFSGCAGRAQSNSCF
jgi:hypothetical protein